jgi:hypothetical protein
MTTICENPAISRLNGVALCERHHPEITAGPPLWNADEPTADCYVLGKEDRLRAAS